MQRMTISRHRVTTSEVLRTYWRFAVERQRVYHARLAGDPGPWTSDPVISQYRFTNAYRAVGRVSQELISVAYKGPQSPDDLVLRVLLFRFFNKPATWQALDEAFGEITMKTFNVDAFSSVLDRA